MFPPEKNGWKLDDERYSINWFEGDVTPPTLHSMASEAEKDTQDSENEADSDLESYSDEDTDSDDSSCNEN